MQLDSVVSESAMVADIAADYFHLDAENGSGAGDREPIPSDSDGGGDAETQDGFLGGVIAILDFDKSRIAPGGNDGGRAIHPLSSRAGK